MTARTRRITWNLLRDDRLGACLAGLFTANTPELLLAIVKNAIEKFQVSLDEIHNDSTSVMFHGKYATAREPKPKAGRKQPAITWGYSKDRRPDLKQWLFTLTLTNDGGVPVYVQLDNGNTNDDVAHRHTWDLLVTLLGSPNFLGVTGNPPPFWASLVAIGGRAEVHFTRKPGGSSIRCHARTWAEPHGFG